jgi:hypothetical protein
MRACPETGIRLFEYGHATIGIAMVPRLNETGDDAEGQAIRSVYYSG